MQSTHALLPQLPAVLEAVPVNLLVISPDFHILTLSESFLKFSSAAREQLTGRTIFDIYISHPFLFGEETCRQLKASLQQAVLSRQENRIAIMTKHRTFEVVNTPVQDETGGTSYIVHTIAEQPHKNIEQLLLANEKLEQQNEKLKSDLKQQTEKLTTAKRETRKEKKRLTALVRELPAGLAILSGSEMRLEFVNKGMLKLWDRDSSIEGMCLLEFMPELRDQIFPKILDDVFTTGIAHLNHDAAVELMIDGHLQTVYMDYSYTPLKNSSGQVESILVLAEDVSERTLSRQRERILTEELKIANENLENVNEWFRNMVRQAPVGICIINVTGLKVTEVNDRYLEIVGRKRADLLNVPIWDAISEAEETYKPVLDRVITTGESFTGKEHELLLLRHGSLQTVFIDFVYEPIKDGQGHVKDIMVLAIDVTEKVLARRRIEEMEERARMAVESASMGTFDLDLQKDILLTSERFNAIFGFDSPPSRKDVEEVIYREDQPNRLQAYQNAYKSGLFFYEARVVHKDGSIRWFRVQGKMYADKSGNPSRLLGTVLDITEFKHLQQQKDDFISIASHELKTPVTSLKASLQLLERMKQNPTPEALSRLIEMSGRSIEKVSTLIEDLLNVSRMNEGQLKIHPEILCVNHLLNSCCQHIREAGNHELIIEGDTHLNAFADEHMIDQVITNFVNNAVKYAPQSRQIWLSCQVSGDMIKISVRDQGPGIPKEKQQHLFSRYYQAEQTHYRSSGLGLGLYICSEIVKKHGGQIGVDSEVGKGSCFWFTIPRAK